MEEVKKIGYEEFIKKLHKFIASEFFFEYKQGKLKIFPYRRYEPVDMIEVHIKNPITQKSAYVGIAPDYIMPEAISCIFSTIKKYILEVLEEKMKVKFINVGRNNVNWEEPAPVNNYDDLEYEWLYYQVKKRAFVMSDNIDFFLKEGETKGTITAGFHKIGEFELIFD